MLQRAIVISEQKTVNTILMNLRAIQCASAQVPSGAPAGNLTFGPMLDERRKVGDEKLRKEEEKQKRKVNHPHRKIEKESQKISSSSQKQVMHYSFHAMVQH